MRPALDHDGKRCGRGARAVAARGLLLLALAVSAGGGGGCRRDAAWLDARDREDVMVQRAIAKRQEGDLDGAIKLYLEAVNHGNRAGRAHLDLALLLHHESKDYLGAICHYRRYLELRPETEKRDMIEQRIRRALQMVIASRSGIQAADAGDAAAAAAARVRELERQNTLLRRKLARMSRDAGAEDASAPRRYRVREGDSLHAIAERFYGDGARWHAIFDANRDVLERPEDLRGGQMLRIP